MKRHLIRGVVFLIFLSTSHNTAYGSTTFELPTSSSTWSNRMVAEAEENLLTVKTAEEAELLARRSNKFVREFHVPTQGYEEEDSYGVRIRYYSKADALLLLKNTRKMKKILEELNKKYPLEEYKDRQEQLNEMINKLKAIASYVGQRQQEAFRRMKEANRSN